MNTKSLSFYLISIILYCFPAYLWAESFSIKGAYIPQFSLFYTSISIPLHARFQLGFALMQGNLTFKSYDYVFPEPVVDRSGQAMLTQPSYINFRTQIYHPMYLYGIFISWKAHKQLPVHLKYYAGYHSAITGVSDGERWNQFTTVYDHPFLYNFYKIDLRIKSSYFHAASIDYIYDLNKNWFIGAEAGMITLQTEVKSNVRYPVFFYSPNDASIHQVSNIAANIFARYLIETNLTDYLSKPIPFVFIFAGRRFE